MNNPTTSIDLSNDEAIVLFDFLVRFNQQNNDETFEDQAEQKVLWILENILEKCLVEPFSNDYTGQLLKARKAIRNGKKSEDSENI